MAKKKVASESLFVPVEEQPYPIPENWCYFYFTSLIDIEGGTQPPKSQFIDTCKDGYIRLVQIRDFATDKYAVYVPDTPKMRHFNESDIMIARYGASLGRICIGLKGVYNVALAKTIFSDDILCRRYVYWMLQSESFQAPLLRISRTAQAGFNKADLSTFAMPLPPFPEQHRIVSRIESLFTKLDEAKEKAQAVLDGFELRKSAILHKAFTGELLGLSGSKTIPLEAIVGTIRIGPFGSVLHKEDYIAGGIPVINPKHITNQQIAPEGKVTISEEKALELAAYRLKTGDIIMGRRGEMGRSAPITEKENGWLCGTGSLIIRLQEGYIAAFYSQIIASHSSVQYLEENCVGSTMKNLNEKVIKSLPVPSYTKEQQEAIVAILNSLLEKEQQAKSAAEAVLTQIDSMKKAILVRAFRGELGTNDPSEEWAGELLKAML